MKHRLAAMLCCLFLSLGTLLAQKPADPAPATKEDVQKLFDVMQSRTTMDGIMSAMTQQIPETITAMLRKQIPNATPEQVAEIEAFSNAQVAKMIASAPFGEMIQAMIPVYQRHFTHEEVLQLVQFYSSAIGKKFLKETPALMAESMADWTPVLQKWQGTMMGDLQKNTEEFAKKLREKDSAPAAPAKKE